MTPMTHPEVPYGIFVFVAVLVLVLLTRKSWWVKLAGALVALWAVPTFVAFLQIPTVK